MTCLDNFPPIESDDEEGSGVFDEGSGVLSVTTVTENPEVFFRKTTTESEALGEVVTQQPTGVDFTYTISQTELPLPQPPNATEFIPDLIEAATARPDTGREPIEGFLLPQTGQC